MNFWNGAGWVPSESSFQAAGNGGFLATNVQHKLWLAPDLNMAGAVSLTTPAPENIVLNSTPVAFGLLDAASGRTAIIATVTNCSVLLLNSNEVIYQSAFCGACSGGGVCADVLCRLDKGSYQQDVVITGALDPVDYGFPDATTRIQIITAFYGVPPETVLRPIRIETNQTVRGQMAVPDLIDHTLGFGQAVIAAGRAYANATNSVHTNAPSAPVAKEFKEVDGQWYLFESVEYSSLKTALQRLPRCPPSAVGANLIFQNARTGYGAIPTPPSAARPDTHSLSAGKKPSDRGSGTSSHATAVALASSQRLDPTRPPRLLPAAPSEPGHTLGKAGRSEPSAQLHAGVVIDYLLNIGGNITGGCIFAGDAVYFVDAPVFCNGQVTIEGGAVFKYPTAYSGSQLQEAYLELTGGTINTIATEYTPIIFTAGDDDSIGGSLNGVWGGYTGTIDPMGYASPALWLIWPTMSLSNLCFRYVNVAIEPEMGTDGILSIFYSQFISNSWAVFSVMDDGSTPSPLSFFDCLFVGAGLVLDAGYSPDVADSFTFANCTIDSAGALMDTYNTTVSIGNCILANLAQVGFDVAYWINNSTGGDGNNPFPMITAAPNGFYNSPYFGDGQWGTADGNSPFVTVGDGAHYLSSTSGFVGAGYIGYDGLMDDPTTLALLAKRSTHPPNVIALNTRVTGQLTLSPQAPRYSRNSGPGILLYCFGLHGCESGRLSRGPADTAPGSRPAPRRLRPPC